MIILDSRIAHERIVAFTSMWTPVWSIKRIANIFSGILSRIGVCLQFPHACGGQINTGTTCGFYFLLVQTWTSTWSLKKHTYMLFKSSSTHIWGLVIVILFWCHWICTRFTNRLGFLVFPSPPPFNCTLKEAKSPQSNHSRLDYLFN